MKRRTFMAMAGAGVAMPSLVEAEETWWPDIAPPNPCRNALGVAVKPSLIERINACPGWWAKFGRAGFRDLTSSGRNYIGGVGYGRLVYIEGYGNISGPYGGTLEKLQKLLHIYWIGDQAVEAEVDLEKGSLWLREWKRFEDRCGCPGKLTYRFHEIQL